MSEESERKDFVFDCEYCAFRVVHPRRDNVRRAAKKHLVEMHPNEMMVRFAGQRQKCQRSGCDAHLDEGLVCENGHDNIRWLAGFLVSYGIRDLQETARD
ncbi:MAG: hypothetical protein R6U44_10710 [Archaeoglobaceae archaeon]